MPQQEPTFVVSVSGSDPTRRAWGWATLLPEERDGKPSVLLCHVAYKLGDEPVVFPPTPSDLDADLKEALSAELGYWAFSFAKLYRVPGMGPMDLSLVWLEARKAKGDRAIFRAACEIICVAMRPWAWA